MFTSWVSSKMNCLDCFLLILMHNMNTVISPGDSANDQQLFLL